VQQQIKEEFQIARLLFGIEVSIFENDIVVTVIIDNAFHKQTK